MTEPAIDTGEILEALNDKTDRDCRNVDTTSGADVVIEYQLPTSSNNYTWYRLYKSGWIEQGFLIQVSSASTGQIINLPKEMADTNYSIQMTAATYASSWTGEAMIRADMNTRTTTSFGYQGGQTNANGYCYFEVKGMSAQS